MPERRNHVRVSIPLTLLTRLMAAIETPGDLTEEEVLHLLEDAHEYLPVEEEGGA